MEDDPKISQRTRLSLLAEVLILSIIVAGLHYLATIFSLYWTIGWFDILMHFLGGFLISLFVMYAYKRLGWFEEFKNKIHIYIYSIIAATLIIGLTWELWEVFIGFTNILTDVVDTVLDIIMDIFGAISAFIYKRNKI